MENTLFKKLLGTWILVELIEIPVDGGATTHPMGKDAKGLIIYNADGYMSAQIMNINRENPNQKLDYLAYSGPFHADDEKQMVAHTMYAALYPDWDGQTQNRKVLFKDGFLHLESEKPFTNNSRLVIHRLTWKRVENNTKS